MLWFFQNREKSIRVETRYDSAAEQYVTTVRGPDGEEHVETFDNDRSGGVSYALEDQFSREHFTQVGESLVPLQWSDPKRGNQ